MRQLGSNLSRTIALAVVGLALVVSSSVALAAGPTVGLGVPTGTAPLCNALGDACIGTISGNLSDPAQPGTYSWQFTLDALAVIGNQLCFNANGTNQATLKFTSPGKVGTLVVTTGSICFDNTPDLLSTESGVISVPYTFVSGTDDFANAGDGALTGPYAGSLLGGSNLFTTTPPCIDPSVCIPPCTDPSCGNPGGGATPELDSLLLFGSGLSGIVAYAVQRRRAGKAQHRCDGKLIE